MDIDEAKQLSNKRLFIGSECENLIQKLGLNPKSKQLEFFFDSVRKFHKAAVKHLKGYFSKVLQSSIVEDFSALSQNKRSHAQTPHKLKRLAKSYSKVVRNIDINGLDEIDKEIEQYCYDDDVGHFEDDLSYEDYWKKVSSLTEGENWKRYDILPIFALALGVTNFSNSEVERQFSMMNYVHQNKQRNSMRHDMLDSYLHIRSGVESYSNRRSCDKCKDQVFSADHCHCNIVEITPELRNACSKAYLKCRAKEQARVESRELTKEDQEKFKAFKQKEEERLLKLGLESLLLQSF